MEPLKGTPYTTPLQLKYQKSKGRASLGLGVQGVVSMGSGLPIANLTNPQVKKGPHEHEKKPLSPTPQDLKSKKP